MHRLTLVAVSLVLFLSACGGGNNAPRATDAPPATNSNGTPVTQDNTAIFNAAEGVIPLPNNLLFLDTTDLTLNIPFDPTASSAGLFRALNSLDGWGTTTPWVANFTQELDPASVTPGGSVRFFEVALNSPAGAVIGIVEELTPGVDYFATAQGQNVVIVPLRPLKEITTYLAVITNGVADTQGNNAAPDQQYFIAKRTTPLVDASGNSTDPLLDNATAQSLEGLRQLTSAQEAAAASAGVDPSSIVVSFVATTQSVTVTPNALRGTISPQFSQIAPTGLTTAAIGGPGIADIYIGVMNMPYYLDAPTAENPTGPLTGNWEAAPGAYVPPFDQLGFDPTSTNVTYLNPIPVAKSVQTIPLLVSVPNAGSGMTRPDSGWPVVIFQHGITRNRTDALALIDSMALAGFAVVSIDQPLHGYVPDGTLLDAFYVENTPFGAIAGERTFDLDLSDNATGASGPDGQIDASGTYTINLPSLLTSRDNTRQASADLSVLAITIPTMDFTGDGLPDFDGSQIRFVGQSLGSIVGTSFLAVEGIAVDSGVRSGVLSVPGGGIIGLLLGSPTFGPRIIAGLESLGVVQGSADFDTFVLAAQTVTDPADPINWGELAAAVQPILVQEVVGSAASLPDQVIPNSVPGFPLSGTEPLIAVMGLAPISQTTQDSNGVRGATRFIVGDHGSLLIPTASLEATAEMQGEAASFALTAGTVVQVTIPEVLVQDQ
ncbi:MAG: Ig-like domain-containing protein [Xanthomonadales bacterium]|nr:Ig-like domain-containing protein [Xanthomonadales bacterium]